MKSKYFKIVFEDDDLVIVDKVAGIAVIPEREPKYKSILELLERHYPYVKPVHRIDKDTSGLVIYAKSEEMHKEMNALFYDRTIKKIYIAIVKGHPYKTEFTVNLPLKQSSNSKRMIVSKNGKSAISHIRTIDQTKAYALLEVEIETGRTHQIRAHLAYHKLPIVGDNLYNDYPNLFLSKIKKNYNQSSKEERPLLQRTALHASELSFVHPHTGENIELSSPLPKDMRVSWELLKKHNQ